MCMLCVFSTCAPLHPGNVPDLKLLLCLQSLYILHKLQVASHRDTHGIYGIPRPRRHPR
jgi:hypothetical protein